MIRASIVILVIVCVSTTLEQSIPNSPCPNVFQYEQTGFEPGQWYGVVNLSTDNTLHSLWLNIVLDGKANILGNWVGDVTTNDNIDFKIENTNMKIHPGPAVAVRFFVRYDKLNKPPRVQAIRLNGREICKANANPTIDRPDLVSRPDSRPISESRPDVASRPVERPVSTRPNEARPETRPDSKPIIRAEDSPITRPVYGRPSGDGPVYTPTQHPPKDQSNVNPYSIRPDPSEYFEGGQPTFIVSGSGNSNSGSGSDNSNNRRTKDQCGKVVRNSPNPLVVNGKPTLEGQWPWQIALYQTQTVDNKYICGGTLVSHKHVITAAHCVTRKESVRVVNKNTLTVYLGKHNLRTTVDGVQIRLVGEIIVHPRYNASSFSRDLGILKLRESVQYTDYVRPVCLWPDDLVDLNNVIGKTGSVVGWGFDETGVATEELTLVEMPVVDHLTCIRSYSEFFSRFTSDDTYCAGFRDGISSGGKIKNKRTSVCNGDSGGGMVFRMQGMWYLRGLVSLSVAKHNEYRCDTSHYVIFTDLAKFLPWLKDNIRD
ncbi:proclotting enzyme-like isoform X3 [Pieris brassicae]|uniref:proclotting enzyme-like isoform X3 n=1 Tax=Pieris brassicae TaxID=7116 RepID=UPI001E65F2BA|nr:proclotting enzyme-like isoform X3 [Pieris brassicae]